MLIRCIILTFLFIPTVLASDKLELGEITTDQLEEIFSFYNYTGEKDYLMIPQYSYPPIFCSQFPSDFHSITDENKRNALFIKILAPLALKINQEIMAERKEIQTIFQSYTDKSELTENQIKIIEEKSKKYDIFTRLQGNLRYNYLLNELLTKIHVVAPSVLITASALETNWGTSRIVKEGNSLYKTLVWHTDKGLKPIGETEDDSYRIKTYPDIYTSMKEFALKINSSVSFNGYRDYRQQILNRRTLLLGTTLAPYLVWNSPLKNYAGLLEYTLAYYELNIIDKSVLDSTMIQKSLPEHLSKFKLNK